MFLLGWILGCMTVRSIHAQWCGLGRRLLTTVYCVLCSYTEYRIQDRMNMSNSRSPSSKTSHDGTKTGQINNLDLDPSIPLPILSSPIL